MLLQKIVEGRTDLVFDYVAGGESAASKDEDGVSLISCCAYYGDVSAMRFLLSHGETLPSPDGNLDLNGACYHGHWKLAEFLIEQGADVNRPLPDTGETPLHAALSKSNRPYYNLVVKVLLAHGADPNRATIPGVETGSFMRDCRTKGETALHRAAAFGDEEAIDMLLAAGASKQVRDAHGDTPLSWASWYERPRSILIKLCYGPHHIRSSYRDAGYTQDRGSMDANLRGRPVLPAGK